MKRLRQEAPYISSESAAELGRKQTHIASVESVVQPIAAFEELEAIKFEMRNMFLEAKSKETTPVRLLRQFFNRTNVNRPNVIKTLSPEAFGNFAELIEQHNAAQARTLVRMLARLHLQARELAKLLASKHIESLREQIMELVCSNLERPGYVEQEERKQRCELCRTIITEHLLPRYSFTEKYGRYYITLLGYYVANATDRKAIIEECKASFIGYLTSSRKMVGEFLQQLLPIPELQPVLSKLIQQIVEARRSVSEEFEEYICANLSSILQILHLTIKPQIVLSFFCLKIKSLSFKVKKAALESLISYPELPPQTIRLMIVKDTLGRTVDHCRGIFLQLLEDEFYEMRILTIRCLRTFSLYLDRGELKEVMFYMVNDNNESVRIEALRALISVAHDYLITGEDLNTMLMCLKDRRVQFRYYVYRLAGIVTVVNQDDFLDFIDKLIRTLKIFKEDKVYLYTALRGLGSKSKHFILGNIKRILEIADLEDQHQPSWKNILYKARVILVASCFEANYYEGIKENSTALPSYFLKHFEYIRDVEPYAFERPLVRDQITRGFSGMNLTTRHNQLLFLRSHVILWERTDMEVEPAIKSSTEVEQQYLRGIFQLGCLHHQLEAIMSADSAGDVRVQGLLKRISSDMVRLDCSYQCIAFDLFRSLSRLNCFLAALITYTSLLRLDRSKVSEAVIAIAKYLRQLRIQYTTADLMSNFEQIELTTRRIMTEMGQQGHLQQHCNSLKQLLKSTSAFNMLFVNLKALTKLEVQANILKLSLPAQNNKAELCVHIEAQSHSNQLEDYYLRIERKLFADEYIQILDGERIDSLEDSHKTMFSIRLAHNVNIKRVSGVKNIGTGDSSASDMFKLLGMKDQQFIEMSSLQIS